MRISAINNNYNKRLTFKADEKTPEKLLHKALDEVFKDQEELGKKADAKPEEFAAIQERLDNIKKTLHEYLKKAIQDQKALRKNKSTKPEEFTVLKERYDEIKKVAEKLIGEVKIPGIFKFIVKHFGKINLEKTGNKNIDMASKLTTLVLWGNVGKEAVGTTLYTIQALTNEDLPEDKRKFVGMYDLAVGIVSTAFSFIFGVGLEKTIKNGYINLLKPLSEAKDPAMRAKTGAAIVGLAAFSSFFLQTIIGKRIFAPAIATPMAGKMKAKMEAADAVKKQKQQPKIDDQTFEQAISNSNILAKVIRDTDKDNKI